jgi:hypothetical protein
VCVGLEILILALPTAFLPSKFNFGAADSVFELKI